jgi:hypothetical protein
MASIGQDGHRASRRWLAGGLIGLGITALVVAAGWWWLVFGPVVRSALLSLPQAGSCLAVNSDICILAESLCRGAHLINIRHYSSELFWLGVALLGISPFAPIPAHWHPSGGRHRSGGGKY